MKLDNQLAAFICGLFIGLMVVKHTRRKVVEVDIERQEAGHDGNQNPASAVNNLKLIARGA
jgi:hypothetical protein